MKRTQLLTKTTKNLPADETSKNAQLLIQAGYIHKEMAGVYTYLPLGLRVVEKIKQIVREEMNKINSSELIMTNLQPADRWQETHRWSDEVVDIWFKTRLKDETELGLAWSHEEAVINMMRGQITSYRDLPVSLYQFQAKLRNELRAKSGIMRGREFVMKDMYSMHATAEDLATYYDQAIEAYKRVYDRLGIGDDTYVTFASGGAFTKFSHEFQTVCEAGEDILYVHREKNIAVNEEVLEEACEELKIDKSELEKVKSAEVGNIFNFGTDKSKDMNFTYADDQDQHQHVYLGSYGIGITRAMGVIAEKFSDEKGLIWPKAIAPYQIYLVSIGEQGSREADKLYQTLTDQGVEVLYDDRDIRPGQKFADAELLGIPLRITVSDRLVEQSKYEITNRKTGENSMLTFTELADTLGTHV
ncbi:His/Gly/Thr/Pro-type tRNA ligase C-terminal domain-containing protein [Candidatus Saccharibacteria bacterium]|nr:His/Gly/Thr/Pro-type tRNA ligase C-terminal domain-containing protein [Candidatus Saccharibacteria bacterium]